MRKIQMLPSFEIGVVYQIIEANGAVQDGIYTRNFCSEHEIYGQLI